MNSRDSNWWLCSCKLRWSRVMANCSILSEITLHASSVETFQCSVMNYLNVIPPRDDWKCKTWKIQEQIMIGRQTLQSLPWFKRTVMSSFANFHVTRFVIFLQSLVSLYSYGTLGDVPPLDFQLFNFFLVMHFRAAQTLTLDSMWLPTVTDK